MVRTKHLPGRPSVGVTASLLIALLGNAPQRGFHVPEWSQRHDGHLAPPRGCMCQSCFLTHAFYLIWNHPASLLKTVWFPLGSYFLLYLMILVKLAWNK